MTALIVIAAILSTGFAFYRFSKVMQNMSGWTFSTLVAVFCVATIVLTLIAGAFVLPWTGWSLASVGLTFFVSSVLSHVIIGIGNR